MDLPFCTAEPDRIDEYYDNHRKITFRDQIDSDRRKFHLADENGDGKLDREEMAVYLHPSDFPKMREFVLTEHFNLMDGNKDGRVTKEEYLGQCTCPLVCLSVCLCVFCQSMAVCWSFHFFICLSGSVSVCLCVLCSCMYMCVRLSTLMW